MYFSTVLLLTALTTPTFSLPTVSASNYNDERDFAILRQKRDNITGAAGTVVAIMPKSISCDGCGDECTTAAVAAPYLVDAMYKYGVTTGYEQAGVLALVAYESVEMQYKVNQVPAHKAAGQGTVNEQSGAFNVEYANSFPELDKLNLTTSNVLDYVTQDQYNFGSGAWYYSSQDTCTDSRNMARNGAKAWDWFSEYMAGCVGVNLTNVPDQAGSRIGYWNAALAAFHITNETVNI